MDKSLSLCDPHNSIVHQFGCEGSCTKTAAICLKGCTHYLHQQKVGKHQFINAKELYSVVGCIREKYSEFKLNFKEVYVKRFFQEVKASLKSFETYMGNEFLQKNPLVDLFCKYTSSGGDMFQQVIEDNLDQVQFSQLKCREIYHLKQFQQVLQKQGKEEQEKRVMRLLSRVFEYHLRAQKIILPQKGLGTERKHKQQEMIEVDRLDNLIENLQKKVANIQYTQRQQKIDQLLLIINSGPKDIEKNIQNISFINKMYSGLQNYMEKTLPQRLILAVNFPLVKNSFWDNFITFIGNKGLKQVKICTTSEMSANRAFEKEMIAKYENILSFQIKHNTKWQYMSALINKKVQN